MSTIQRITGTNSGLDVDALVKSSMTTYQNKIDKETQNKKVLEYQQEQYKQIMSDSSSFYDKYFDILKTGSLRSTSTYESVSFTSKDDSKVTAKGFAGADVSDYKVAITQIASKATSSYKSADLLNGTKLSVKVAGKDAISVDIVKSDSQVDMKSTAEKLNAALNKAGIDVTAKYSEFSKNIVLESGSMGESVNFQAGLDSNYETYTGKNAKGVITKGTETYNIDEDSNIVTVDNVQFTLKGVTSSTVASSKHITSSSIESLLESDITKTAKSSNTEYTLTNGSKIKIKDDGTTTVTNSNGTTDPIELTSDGVSTTNADGTATSSASIKTTINANGTVKTETTTTMTDAKNITSSSITSIFGDDITKTEKTADSTVYTLTGGSKITIKDVDSSITINDGTKDIVGSDSMTFNSNDGSTIKINGDGSTITTTKTTTTNTNNITSTSINSLLGNNITKTAESSNTEYTLTDKSKITIADDGTTTITKSDGTILGASAEMTFTSSDGTTKTIKGDGTLTTAATDTSVSLTGKTDVTALKDKIVKFVDDYNTLLKSISTKIFETRDKSYMPLTDEQKKSMTDDQIKSWETKAKTGLLRKDSDLERITSAMKSAMSSVMSGSGSYLESIGIKPVDDYTDKNGTFTVDESKLTQALEENAGNVKDLFTRSTSTTTKDGVTTTTDKGGIITQLESIFKSEFKSSSSLLAGKVGLDGTSTQYNNTVTLAIAKKKQLLVDLNTSFTTKENALYKKYSALETAMQKLNSQQSSLSSMLGTS